MLQSPKGGTTRRTRERRKKERSSKRREKGGKKGRFFFFHFSIKLHFEEDRYSSNTGRGLSTFFTFSDDFLELKLETETLKFSSSRYARRMVSTHIFYPKLYSVRQFLTWNFFNIFRTRFMEGYLKYYCG